MKPISVDESSDTVTIALSTLFYGTETVLSAANAFTDHFWVELMKEKEKIIIQLNQKEGVEDRVDLQELGNEFCNYALGLRYQTKGK